MERQQRIIVKFDNNEFLLELQSISGNCLVFKVINKFKHTARIYINKNRKYNTLNILDQYYQPYLKSKNFTITNLPNYAKKN